MTRPRASLIGVRTVSHHLACPCGVGPKAWNPPTPSAFARSIAAHALCRPSPGQSSTHEPLIYGPGVFDPEQLLTPRADVEQPPFGVENLDAVAAALDDSAVKLLTLSERLLRHLPRADVLEDRNEVGRLAGLLIPHERGRQVDPEGEPSFLMYRFSYEAGLISPESRRRAYSSSSTRSSGWVTSW